MEAGKLRHRITLQSPSRTTSPVSGETLLSWSDTATIWAGIQPLSANEQTETKQTVHRVTHEISIRYREGVTSDMRVKLGTRIFHITGVRNIDERNVELRLSCSEIR